MCILSHNPVIHIERFAESISDAELSLLARNEHEGLINRFGNLHY